MNADELRSLAQSVPERKRQQEEDQRLQLLKRLSDAKWAKARQAVAELEGRVREAATDGKFETVVYRAAPEYIDVEPGGTGPNDFFCIKTVRERAGWFKKEKQGRGPYVISNLPECAQYVFRACPLELHPHWVVCVSGHWAPQGCSTEKTEIELHVKW